MKVRIYIWFLLMTLSVVQGFGQFYTPCIQIDRLSGRYCVGETVIITNCIAPTGPNSSKVADYYFDLRKDKTDMQPSRPNEDLPLNHIYTKPGKYVLAQYGGKVAPLGAPDTAFINIEILEKVPPRFTVGLCEGFKVEVAFTDGVYNSYTITNIGEPDVNYPATPSTVPPPPYTKTYADATPRIITVRGECGLSTSSNQFTPISTIIPVDVLSQTAETYPNTSAKDSAVILIDAKAAMKYKILQYQAGVWVTIRTLGSLNGLRTLPKLALGAGGEYFTLITYDACGRVDSSVHLVIPRLKADSTNNRNLLSWTPIPAQWQGEITGIQIMRNGVSIANLPPGAIDYIDQPVVCGRTYNYSLKIIYIKTNALNGRPIESNSAPRTVLATSNNKPPAVINFNSSVEGNNVKLTWDQPVGTALYYTISRAEEGKNFSLLNYSNYNSFIDKKAEASTSRYCYKISLTDSCKNTSDDSLITCNILLTTQKKDDDTHDSKWWPYQNGTTLPFVYTIEVFDQSNKLINSFVVNDTNFTFSGVALDIPSYRYRVKVSDPVNATKFYYSNYTEVKNDILIFVPDIFTPNQDGDNEEFKALGKYLKDFTLSIFNRWGELVFYSENMNLGWNGEYKGSPSIPGVYAYIITATDNSNNAVTKKGTVILHK